MKILHVLSCRRLPLDDLADAVAFYEGLFGEPTRLDLTPMEGLRIVQAASMLLIGAAPEILPTLDPVQAAYLVEDLPAFAAALPRAGAVIVRPPAEIATGANMIVRHPDGMLVEYVEHRRKNPADALLAARPRYAEA